MTSRSDNAAPLYGLVMAGGRSTRMGIDKALLEYHGRPQIVHAYEMLQRFCQRVYVSARQDQIDAGIAGELPCIADGLHEIGPMAGVLAALNTHPEASWLVLACDLPLMDAETLTELVEARAPDRLATALMSADGLLEPMCAVYEPACAAFLVEVTNSGQFSLREFLMHANTRLLTARKPHVLTNVNTPDEYRDTCAILKSGLLTSPIAKG